MTPRPCVAALLAGWAAVAAAQSAGGSLEELEDLLNQPVYAASKFTQDAAAAPASVTVLTAGDIRAYGWRTLAEVLNAVRGVYLRDDRSYTYVGVRGFARPGDYSSRMLVTIDGMRANDNIYDQALGGREFPLEVGLIERVEFIAGPGSSLYGSNAQLGVINIVTKSASTLGGTQVAAGLGSRRQKSLTLRHGGSLGAGSLVLGAHLERRPGGNLYFPEFDDPATNNGVAVNLDREVDRKFFAKWTQGEWSAAFVQSNRDKQVPTAAYGVDFNAPYPYADRYALADLQWRRELGHAQWFARVSLGQYRFVGTGTYGADLVGYDQTGRWLLLEGQWLYRGWADHVLALGAEAQRNFKQTQILTITGPSADQSRSEGGNHRFGLYVNDDWALSPQWRLVLGVRADRLLSGATAVTPRAALIWQPRAGLYVKLLDGVAYREPNAWESQYGDPTQLPNPDLKNERLRATELAVDWRALPNLRLAGSRYRNKVTDLIDQVEIDPDAGTLQYRNVGRAEGRGLELEADYVADAGWRVRASWSRADTTDGASGSTLGNAPRSLFKVHAGVPLPWGGARLGAEWQRIGQRLTAQGTRMPASGIVNATLRIAPAGVPWTVSASAYNLLDKVWSDPGGPETAQDTLPRDGRAWQFQLGWQF